VRAGLRWKRVVSAGEVRSGLENVRVRLKVGRKSSLVAS